MEASAKKTIVCVDALAVRTNPDGSQDILLITRGRGPNKGCFAFPGGHLEYNEDPEIAVLRELKEETTLEGKNLGLFAVKGKAGRDPRGHTVSIVYLVEVDPKAVPKGEDDAESAKFYPIKDLIGKKESFAFDHYEIFEEYVNQNMKK